MNLQRSQGSAKSHCLLWKKYRSRVRWFHSKGAYLILIWVFLSSLTTSFMSSIQRAIKHHMSGYQEWFVVVPPIICVLVAVPLGWLAYTNLGIYKTVKSSLLLVFMATFTISVFSLFLEIDFVHFNKYFGNLFFNINSSIFSLGATALFVCLLQLGLDQMPDASSSSITSFIAWLLAAGLFGGIWLGNLLFTVWFCTDYHEYTIRNIQLWSLLPVTCVSIVLITDFLFSKMWLVNIEPKPSKPIKAIYQVLKFAAKHKAPLNRSAFTYWEEDVPSRMDLGKSRYGGPFTTEQVEDVKTILRLLAVSLSFWFINFGLTISPEKIEGMPLSVFKNMTLRSKLAIAAFTYESEWCFMVTAILFEFAIYPVIRNRIPSIMRRIGFVSLVITILSIVFLIIQLIGQLSHYQLVQTSTSILFYSSKGVLEFLLLSAYIELVCAQVPYNLRGCGIGYIAVCIGLPLGIGQYISLHSVKFCNDCDIRTILLGIKTGLSLVGFILYCILTHWYKRRVRDEDYHPQPVVEEIYDRYLTRKYHDT